MSEWRSSLRGGGKRLAAVAALAVLAGGAALASTSPAPEELPVFGMLGITRDQSAVLSLVLVEPLTADDPGCRVTASFVDARGQVFIDGRGNPVQQTFALRGHTAAFLTLNGADILGTQVRTPIRPVLVEAPDDASESECSCLMASEEIVDQTGRTDVGVWAQRPRGGGNPPPPPVCVAQVQEQ